MNSIKITFLIIVGIIFGVAVSDLFKHAPNTYLVTAMQDTLRVTRDSLNRETAYKLTLISDAKTLNKVLQSNTGLLKDKDEKIKKLMKATSKTNDATYVKLETTDTVFIRPTNVDTVSHVYIYESKDNWFEYKAVASKESLNMQYKITNEYVIRHDNVKNGVETTISNMNPHTSTTEVISYKTAYPKIRKWGIGPAIGYGYGLDGRRSAFVGVVLTRTLVRF